ncbi:MAG: hypothetical protein HFJ65_00955 [Eggerthellaceae bacterium]|nr:hypothetical protein [Eggerthellaceae bacterium]
MTSIDNDSLKGSASQEAPSKDGASAISSKKIPGTSVAVMITVLLLALLFGGIYVVTSIIDAQAAAREIKGKGENPAVEYPIEARLPNGIAAQVGDVEIPESVVEDYIHTLRERLDLTSQEAWDEWMKENGFTTESLRYSVIKYYVNLEIVDQMAKEYGVEPTEEDIQRVRDQAFATPEAEQAIKENLEAQGRTMEDYEADLRMSAQQELLQDVVTEGLEDTDAFKKGVLRAVKNQYPEYEEAESLDEVDPEIVEEMSAQVAYLSKAQTYANYLNDFMKEIDILYSKMPTDVDYRSNSDAYFSQEIMKLQIQEMLKNNGLLEEDSPLSGLLGTTEEQTTGDASAN